MIERLNFVLLGYNWKTGEEYPKRTYIFYTLEKAIKEYREEFGLKWKRNIEFTILQRSSIGGGW